MEINMSNKNPFEIRADMLKMAKDYMDQSWHNNLELAQRMYTNSKISTEQFQEAFKPYSMEALMEKATEMYKFVSKKD
jgi:hypothetical protein